MAKHSQKVERRLMICSRCKLDRCDQCVNIPLVILGRPEACQCKKKGHDGEPRDKQIADPFTGDVHAPGMVIKTDGSIERRPKC